jgi:effector-binding domain-containing protein
MGKTAPLASVGMRPDQQHPDGLHAFRAAQAWRGVLSFSWISLHRDAENWGIKRGAFGMAPEIRETSMSRLRLAPVLTAAALVIAFAWPQQLSAQTRVPTQSIDPFGQEVTLTPQTIVYVAGSGTWDQAFNTLTDAFKKVGAYLDKAGLKASGPVMAIYTSTDDTGFDFQAAVPLAERPKTPPDRGITFGQSPAGKVLKFVHRGSYDEMAQTYEAITNFLDQKGLDAKDLLIEQYLTDLGTSPGDRLVVNVFVPLR